MKHALLGTILIGIALFTTPCFIEPTDIIVSTAYITALVSIMGDVAYPIVIMWAALGYCMLIIGVTLIGHSLTKRIPILNRFRNTTRFIIHHPFKTSLIIFSISIVFAYIVIVNVGLI